MRSVAKNHRVAEVDFFMCSRLRFMNCGGLGTYLMILNTLGKGSNFYISSWLFCRRPTSPHIWRPRRFGVNWFIPRPINQQSGDLKPTDSRGPETEPWSLETELRGHRIDYTHDYRTCFAAWYPFTSELFRSLWLLKGVKT